MNWLPERNIYEVADGIFTVIQGHGEQGVSNASFILEEKRAFIVDTMTFPEMAAGMAQEIARHTAQVETVLNTHHHIDHMGGNKLFADAQIVAHAGSIAALQRLGFPTNIYDRLMPQFKGRFNDLELVTPAPIQAQLAIPRKGELRVFTPAHTAADMAVWLPESRVLLSGDLCFIGVVPLSVNGLISGWIAALNELIALQPAIVVPGHGPIGTGTDLINLRNYFIQIEQLGQQAVTEHLAPHDVVSLLDPGPLKEWIETDRHLINIERAMQEASGEISRNDLSAMPRSTRKA